MKKLSIKYKIAAVLLVLAFTFQSMESINSHTYKTGVDSYHYTYSCFVGKISTHLAIHCDAKFCNTYL
ncbi:hypothetical protein [Winogradskyella helgolandensis]|uniref:hypothetical protein n=1 Tax=Winogradskyella helgolandensis TaxID=2697010 RepID=UPI0015BA831A|nr:hypothetical protein [Winogradskyella helgolandensis]